MHRLVTLGTCAFIVGLAGALLNLWAVREFPGTWGGTNIGGGLLLIGCYILTFMGAVMAVGGAIGLWLRKRRGGSDSQ